MRGDFTVGITRKVTGLFAMLALAGCSGSSVDYTSAKAIATALDTGGFACAGWEPNAMAIMVRESGTCTHGSTNITMSTYNGANQMQQFNELLKASGWASGVIVEGDQWQVNTNDKEQAVAVQAILGGDIQ